MVGVRRIEGKVHHVAEGVKGTTGASCIKYLCQNGSRQSWKPQVSQCKSFGGLLSTPTRIIRRFLEQHLLPNHHSLCHIHTTLYPGFLSPLSIPSMSSLLLYYPRDDRGEIPGSAIGEGLPSHVNSSTRRLLSSSTTCIGIAVHYHYITINNQQHGIVNRGKGVLMSWAR